MSLYAGVSTRPTSTFPPSKPQRDQRIERVVQAIHADPSQDISALALMVNLSVSRLSHLFKLERDCRLRSYLVDCRLGLAARALQSGKTPVKEISYNVGYQHPPSFARAFHARFGCSPKEYRLQHMLRKCS